MRRIAGLPSDYSGCLEGEPVELDYEDSVALVLDDELVDEEELAEDVELAPVVELATLDELEEVVVLEEVFDDLEEET